MPPIPGATTSDAERPDGELAVRFHQLLTRNQRRQHRAAGNTEDQRQHAETQRDGVEDFHAQHAQYRQARNREQQEGAAVVGGDQEGTFLAAIHPDPRAQSEYQRRGGAHRHEDAHLGRRRVQHKYCGKRQRQKGDLRAEAGNGRADPQLHEVGVPPETGKAEEHRRTAVI